MFPKTPKLIFKLKDLFSAKILVKPIYSYDLETITDESMTISKQLRASLKQLEFISFFETHIDKRKEASYSLSFLQELERIKYDSQNNIIELLEYQKAI